MGRLFWKFFICILLIELIAMTGVGFSFWIRDKARAEQAMQQGVQALPPPHRKFADPRQDYPPVPPRKRHHLLPPFEALLANLIVGLVSAAFLAWYFSKPIRSLRNAFDAVADGKLETRVGPSMGSRRDELADLSHDFDRMADRLQTLMDSQRHLLHDVSHELRSPLARLQAAIGLVRQKPEKLASTMDRIELESVRIDTLVGELLTLSRLEAGVMGSLQEDVNMGELVADIVDDARFEAEIQGRTVDFQGNCDVIVQGRADLLGRAIENVVRNAVKHTPQGSWVLVKAAYSAHQNLLQLSILDNGAGVPAAEIDKIFEPFFRGSSGSGNDGHGLGLAIAQRVIQAHGGTIKARNRAGGGLCVEMTFPARRADLP